MSTVDLVIMAGGEGRRLEPFTKVVPKPLLYVDGQSILERTIQFFRAQGFAQRVFILTWYKSELIQAYINVSGLSHVELVVEDEPLGTIGGIGLLRDRLSPTFFVSNCDIVIETDLNELMKNFREKQLDLSMCAFSKPIAVPYGIFEFDDDGYVTNLVEKPTIKLWANAGVYLMSRRVFEYITPGQRMNMDELFYSMMNSDMNLDVFPLDGFHDIGEFQYYKKVLEELC